MASSRSAAAYAELRSKHNRLIEVLGVTVNYKDELTDKIADLTAAVKQAELERDSARSQTSSSAETAAQKDARIDFLENHANENLQIIKGLREQLAAASRVFRAKVSAVAGAAGGLRRQLDALKAEAADAQRAQAAQLQQALQRMQVMAKGQRRKKQGADSHHQQAAAKAQQRVQALEAELAERDDDVQRLKKAAVVQKKRIRELEFKLTEQADGFAAKLSFSKVENSELLKQLSSTRTALKHAEATVAELQEKLANVDDSASSSSASAFKQFLDVKAQNQKLTEQVKRLKARLKK